MPLFYESVDAEQLEDEAEAKERACRLRPKLKYPIIFLCLVFCHYFCSCGIERLFQSMVSFTFMPSFLRRL